MHNPKTKLKLIFFTLLFTLTPLFAQANDYSKLARDGKILLYNYHLNEFLQIEYETNQKINNASIAKLNQFLRSRDSDEQIQIDFNLIRLVDHLQDHFNIDSIEIISGFRSKAFNQKLKKEGHNVANESYHTQGRALDIHIDEIKEESLRDYLLSLKLGGVGYYGPLDFVHIDTGPVRTWNDGTEKSERKLIGVLEPKAQWQLISDKNDYSENENITLTFLLRYPTLDAGSTLSHKKQNGSPIESGMTKEKLKSLNLQHFFRGKWEDQKKLEFHSILKLESKNLKPGKYRVLFWLETDDNTYSSNEFYVKKK